MEKWEVGRTNQGLNLVDLSTTNLLHLLCELVAHHDFMSNHCKNEHFENARRIMNDTSTKTTT